MCGIYGIFQLDGVPADPALMPAMGRVIVHRGPDEAREGATPEPFISLRNLCVLKSLTHSGLLGLQMKNGGRPV